MAQPEQKLILVVGRTGQLARALAGAGHPRSEASENLEDNFRVHALGRADLDMAAPQTIQHVIERLRPAGVINASAYNFVDAAETDPTEAFLVNRDGPGVLARICAELAIPLVHVSTDYVFGEPEPDACRPFRETDTPAPMNRYGQSKLEGERIVLSCHSKSSVIRTCWVYSPEGKNFVTLMLGLAREGRSEVRVVEDQVGRPTYADDLASACLRTLKALDAGDERFQGVLHYCGDEDISRASFAEAIFEGASKRGLPCADVVRITASEFAAAAPRPSYSALDITRASGLDGLVVPHWRERLDACLDRIARDQGG